MPLATTEWKSWADLPWLARGNPAADLDICLPLLESVRSGDRVSEYLRESLPHVAAEFASNWTAIVERHGEWVKLFEFGRQPFEGLPSPLFAEVQDRDAAVFSQIDGNAGSSVGLVAAPLRRSMSSPRRPAQQLPSASASASTTR